MGHPIPTVLWDSIDMGLAGGYHLDPIPSHIFPVTKYSYISAFIR